jgi:hypothetical protein
MVICPYCKIDYKNLTQHIRFKHPIPDTTNPISIENGIGGSGAVAIPPGSAVAAHTPQILTPQSSPAAPANYSGYGAATPDPLDQLEKDTLRQLRILNLNNMIKQIGGQNEKPQFSEIDQFTKFVEAYQKIQDAVLDNAPEQMPDDPMTALLMSFLPNMMKSRQAVPGGDWGVLPQQYPQSFNKPSINPSQQDVEGAANNMNINQLPKEYINAVKSGEIDEEKAWNDFKNGIKFHIIPQELAKTTREEFHKEFERVKNG